jgi:hypothetical protein
MKSWEPKEEEPSKSKGDEEDLGGEFLIVKRKHSLLSIRFVQRRTKTHIGRIVT